MTPSLVGKPRRVAVVVAGMNPVTQTIWREMNERTEVHLFGLKESNDLPIQEFEVSGVAPSRHYLQHWPGNSNLNAVVPRYYRRLGKTYRHLDYDLIHLHMESWSIPVIQTLLLRGAGRIQRDTAICVHGCENLPRHGLFLRDALRSALQRAVFNQLDGYASWNTEGIVLARARGLPTSSPSVVAPGVLPPRGLFYPRAASERLALKRKYGIRERDLLVGYVGRFVEEKGVLDLVAAVSAVNSTRISCVFLGSGPLETVLTSELRQRRLSGVVLPFKQASDTAEIIGMLDILVLPSRTKDHWAEQFGRVVVEAMSSRVAVIASDSGSLPEVIGEAGLVFPESNINELVAAIKSLSYDERRNELALQGEKRANTWFSSNEVCNRLYEFWRSSIHARVMKS